MGKGEIQVQEKEYSIGLDIGVTSVGYSVIDKNNKVVRFNNKNMMGVRLFKSGDTAQKRRGFRSTRRRLARRRNRIIYLRELIGTEVLKNDCESQELALLDKNQNYVGSKDVLVCSNFFTSPLQTRIVNNKLLQKIEQDINLNFEYKNKILTHLQGAVDLLQELLLEYQFLIDITEIPEINDFLKSIKVKYKFNIGLSPYENIIELIDVVSELKLYKVIILVNVYSYLTSDEIQRLIKHIKYKKVATLMIETKELLSAVKDDNILLIDEDYDDNFIKL